MSFHANPFLAVGLAQAKCNTAKIVPLTAGTPSGVTSQIHGNRPAGIVFATVPVLFSSGPPLAHLRAMRATALTGSCYTRSLLLATSDQGGGSGATAPAVQATFRPRRRS